MNKWISVAAIAVMVVAVGAIAWSLYGPGVTGRATGYSGYSSYEEMMAAHHGGGGQGGCGMDSGVQASAATGELTSYGITMDSAGYEQLLDFAANTTLTAEQMRTIVGLNVLLPCCGFAKLQATDNCECGHHVALFGLAKLLASKGWNKAAIQTEIDSWKVLFFPEGGAGPGGC